MIVHVSYDQPWRRGGSSPSPTDGVSDRSPGPLISWAMARTDARCSRLPSLRHGSRRSERHRAAAVLHGGWVGLPQPHKYLCAWKQAALNREQTPNLVAFLASDDPRTNSTGTLRAASTLQRQRLHRCSRDQDQRLSVNRCTHVPQGRRTGSARSRPDHDRSQRQPLYRCSPGPERPASSRKLKALRWELKGLSRGCQGVGPWVRGEVAGSGLVNACRLCTSSSHIPGLCVFFQIRASNAGVSTSSMVRAVSRSR